jgi:hypothetical protein
MENTIERKRENLETHDYGEFKNKPLNPKLLPQSEN